MKNNIEGGKPKNIAKEVGKKLVGPVTALTLLFTAGAAVGCEGKTVNNYINIPPIAGTPRPPETVTVPGPERIVTKEVIKEVPGQTIYVTQGSEISTFPAPGYDVYTPRPELGYGDFYSVRFNQNTGHYDLIDVQINQRVNIAEHMVQPIENLLTGVGNTRQISYSLNPGEAAVEQGNNVNGECNGVFQIRVNRSSSIMSFNPTIGDGAVTKVPIANVAAHEADALNRAVDMNWARNNVRGEI